jgi:protein gp37
MAKTKIGWTDWTSNCFWGCNNGCSYCTSRGIAKRFGAYIAEKRGYSPETGLDMSLFKPEFLYDQLLAVPKKPCKVFISMMGDWAADWHKDSCREILFEWVREHPEHTIQLLTKQPQNLIKWSPFPDNCWVGLSVTNWKQWSDYLFWEDRFEAKVKFVSIEPLMQQLYFTHLDLAETDDGYKLKWIIIGQQTPVREKTTPKIEWIREIVEAADKAGVPVFLKNNLNDLIPINDCPLLRYGPAGELKLRQEFPK